ncbi:MAG: serine hydrolase [Candidatus Cloacimonetes bacterium]|nr:serine hydrolase [Candidatus Cloacimonadota bacterium]
MEKSKPTLFQLSFLLSLILLSSCVAKDDKAILGRWEATVKQPDREDTYIFSIECDIWGSLFGNITTYMDGNLLPSTRISKIDFDFPYFSMKIENLTVPVKYTGEMSADKTRLIGEFIYVNPHIESAKLTLIKSGTDQKKVEEYSYSIPVCEEFPCKNVSEAGLDKNLLEDMINSLRHQKYGMINSVLIYKDNTLVLEEYLGGFSRNKLHQMQSVTKSITSLLIGIAIDKGLIGSIDDNITAYIAETEWSTGWEKVTIRHLLTMTSGVNWENSKTDADLGTAEILGKPIIYEPGSRFEYNAAMQLLAEILVNASGKSVADFAKENLFLPLGIINYKWGKSADNNYHLCTGALQLTSLDLLKIGILVKQKGRWNNIQIISEHWIEEATSIQVKIPRNRDQHYGYLWWQGKVKLRSGRIDSIFAHGMGSQFIFIIPDRDMIIITTGNNFYNHKHLAPFKILRKYI